MSLRWARTPSRWPSGGCCPAAPRSGARTTSPRWRRSPPRNWSARRPGPSSGRCSTCRRRAAFPLAETLLTYLRCGDNAVVAAERLHIHEQTVRYRLRRIAELTGGRFTEPEGRLDLMLMLSWLVRTARAEHASRGGRASGAGRTA